MTRLQYRGSLGVFVTSDNLNPILQVTTWLLLAVTFLLLGFRLLTRLVLKANRKFGIEEVFIILAFILGAGQSATVLAPQARIFAKDWSLVTAKELIAGLKAQYAGDLLFIFSACFAKLSVCASFLALSVDEKHRFVTYGIGSVVIAWSISSIFGLSFRCGTYGTWHGDKTKCINELVFLKYVSIGNLVTDSLLILLPAWVVCPINMPLRQRAAIMLFFSARIMVVIAVIVELVFLPRLFRQAAPREVLPYYIAVQAAQSGSVSTACITYFWPFMRSLRSGLFWQTKSTFTTKNTLATLSRGPTESSWIKTDERKDSRVTSGEQDEIRVKESVTSERVDREDERITSIEAHNY
ncbi:hypothetical protein CC78DRAFT_529655 [Lojkania enalia]|uniref:Rhodopsin domain-containing protein n=1 Tax=Lojkania enalia TaxID=147567 RepID=A0A9P4N9F1_9PLEO|nr:hypothetical protein CC78DRAFT_529655 [Didymosphaeria enalia]